MSSNRSPEQHIAEVNQEAVKTFLVALDFYGKILNACTTRREELGNSDKYHEALGEAKGEAHLGRTIESPPTSKCRIPPTGSAVSTHNRGAYL